MPASAPLPPEAFLDRPFDLTDHQAVERLALDMFQLHAAYNTVYRTYLQALRIDPVTVTRMDAIPGLPITAFRTHQVLLDGLEPRLEFTSSGTTGAITSTHHVPWPELYERSFMTSFRAVYGDPRGWRIIALLPAYLERPGSSLVFMAQHLIAATNDPLSGTYLHRYDQVADLLQRSEDEGRRTLLLGVTFALLDLAERFPMPLQHTVIMETGGMKGRRPEIVREAVHQILKEAFHVPAVHSEYGMTELLSQAWSTGDGIYRCPPWMQVRIREVNDPFAPAAPGRTGGIDVIDLCNIASCPFISTQDLGRMHEDGAFEVLGRFDHSDVRGCNLLVV